MSVTTAPADPATSGQPVSSARSRPERQAPARQRVRRASVLVTFLLLPVILNYFSPYIIVDGAARGIVNGSLIAFSTLFVVSLFLGRAFCGWLCPIGGLQDQCAGVVGRPVRGGRLDLIKWAIWVPWVAAIAAIAVLAGGYREVNPLYLTESGISVDKPIAYATYYTVVGLFVVLALTAGRRAVCHYVCWIAPWMIAGRWLRSRVGTPALQLRADPTRCRDCGVCARACPMSLDVPSLVRGAGAQPAAGQTGSATAAVAAEHVMDDAECILCGTCVDGCKQQVIRYSFGTTR